MKLVIVVPCYNEEEVLAETTRQLSSVVDELLSWTTVRATALGNLSGDFPKHIQV